MHSPTDGGNQYNQYNMSILRSGEGNIGYLNDGPRIRICDTPGKLSTHHYQPLFFCKQHFNRMLFPVLVFRGSEYIDGITCCGSFLKYFMPAFKVSQQIRTHNTKSTIGLTAEG